MASSSIDDKPSKRTKKRKKKCEWMCKNGSLLLLLFATVAGFVLGLALKSRNLSNHTIFLIGFPGNLVLRAFMMIIVPLLFCSLVLGISSLRKGGDAKMVAITIAFFLGLSTFSAVMGATAGHLIHPGHKIMEEEQVAVNSTMSGRKGVILDSMLDLLWNAVPSNIIEATFSKEYTHVEIIHRNDTETSENNSNAVIYKKNIKKKSGINFMGLLMFSILFGCALANLGDKGEQLHQTIEQLNAIVMSIMKYFLNLLPVGMFFWMFREGLESAAPERLFSYLGLFLATAFGCIAFHQFILLPILYLIIVRKNPIPFHLNLLPAILTAFGTCSSAATLPATVRCAEEVNRLNRCVTRFVLPLGMVVHMNGGTFYVTLSSIFLAQLEGITIGTAETVILWRGRVIPIEQMNGSCHGSMYVIWLALPSIGEKWKQDKAPGTAGGANPVYLLTAMAATGIEKPQYISFVLSMEWLMERFRTVMNVVADSYVAALVAKLCQEKLPEDGNADSIEFVSPVLDGYQPHTRPVITTVCSHCGSQIDATT